ncbi:MAG: cyclase family protein [Rhodanobacteraceae bacterium]
MVPTTFYDLSQPIFHDAPQWPEYDPVVVSRRHTIAYEGFNAERLELTTHSGTHVDVPFHFFENGATVDQIPVDAFTGPCVALDLRHKAPASVIGRDDLSRFAGSIEPGTIVLIKTGWGDKRAVTSEYLKAWPYLDRQAAEYLVERDVKGVGTDTLSIGGIGESERSRAPHLPLLGAKKFIIEDMRIPDELLDGKKRFLCAFPILIAGAGAGWARPVAWDFE